jgi:hypothetical protein
LIRNTLSKVSNDLSVKVTTNVNLRETIDAISGGILEVLPTDATREVHGFPMIALAMLSKQNIFASVVPSDAIKVNLYLWSR